jgi:hypothetical protein
VLTPNPKTQPRYYPKTSHLSAELPSAGAGRGRLPGAHGIDYTWFTHVAHVTVLYARLLCVQVPVVVGSGRFVDPGACVKG